MGAGQAGPPEVPNVLSTWIQVEFVDNYPLSQYRFTDAKGKTRLEDLKHQVPASSTYALSLFGHCVMDGLQCWEVGTRYSEELQDYSDWRVREPIVKRTINGVETAAQLLPEVLRLLQFPRPGHVAGQPEQGHHRSRDRLGDAGDPHLEEQRLARRR